MNGPDAGSCVRIFQRGGALWAGLSHPRIPESLGGRKRRGKPGKYESGRLARFLIGSGSRHGRESGGAPGSVKPPARKLKTMIGMKTLTVWTPFEELEQIQNRLSDSIFRTPARNHSNGETAHWMPIADVMEDDKEYGIVLELPGVKKADVDVRVEDGWLKISGERPKAEEKEGRGFNRIERATGPFHREFRIPKDADPESVSAKYRDGLLMVAIAKREEAKPRRIEVKVG